MTATTHSPNTGNYFIGKGICSFKADGESAYRDLGNVSNVTLSFDLNKLDHFSSRGGLKDKDFSVTLERNGTLKLTLDEFTPANLGLAVMGTVDESFAPNPTVDIFTEDAVSGAFKIVGTNDVGPKITMDLYNVSFTPSGDLGFITDEFGELELEGDVLIAGSGPNVGKRGLLTFTNVTTVS